VIVLLILYRMSFNTSKDNLMPGLSIIVPVYNTAQYLSRCIESILNQSFGDFELLVVNDGSTDNSQEVIEKYALADNRLISFENPNGGLSDARNYGLKHAKGEYITFVDSDAWLDKDFLKILLDLIVSYDCDIAISNFLKTEEELNVVNTEIPNVRIFSSDEALRELYGINATAFTVSCGK
jgi:glycosyltransferase involved in cell wall biosynthesis